MNALHKLAEHFCEFPGIGPRQAMRFVYFLLTKNPTYLESLARLITNIKKEMLVCESCFRFFPRDNAASEKCLICRDKNRDHSALAVVCYDVDLENVEKTHSFNGNYFVLGGSVPILENEPEKKVRSRELLKTVERRSKETGEKDNLKEIILAMSFNSLGENTANYVKDLLSPLAEKYSLKITTLGRGLSVGTELEYSDSETLKNALKNRQ